MMHARFITSSSPSLVSLTLTLHGFACCRHPARVPLRPLPSYLFVAAGLRLLTPAHDPIFELVHDSPIITHPHPHPTQAVQNMPPTTPASARRRRPPTSTSGNTAPRSSLSVGEASPRATITSTTPSSSSKAPRRRSTKEGVEPELVEDGDEEEETMLEEPAEEVQQEKRTTWKVETFCRYAPGWRKWVGWGLIKLHTRGIHHSNSRSLSFYYFSVKPQISPPSPSAKHLRSIPYELRHGQGRTYL